MVEYRLIGKGQELVDQSCIYWTGWRNKQTL